jgi:hypothetical protein
MWRSGLKRTPLNSRALVCQERLLSLRTLHFADSSSSFEYKSIGACEIFLHELPDGLDPKLYKRELQIALGQAVPGLLEDCNIS